MSKSWRYATLLPSNTEEQTLVKTLSSVLGKYLLKKILKWKTYNYFLIGSLRPQGKFARFTLERNQKCKNLYHTYLNHRASVTKIANSFARWQWSCVFNAFWQGYKPHSPLLAEFELNYYLFLAKKLILKDSDFNDWKFIDATTFSQSSSGPILQNIAKTQSQNLLFRHRSVATFPKCV